MYLQITSRTIGVLYFYIEFKSHRFSVVSRPNETKQSIRVAKISNDTLLFFCFFYRLRNVYDSVIRLCTSYITIDIGRRVINRQERLKISWIDGGGGRGRMFNRIQGWQSVGRFGWTSANIAYRGWCVQVCKPAWNFHILFRVQSFHVESERARRQPADGLNNRRRENEVEGKKRGERLGVIPLLVCFVIHRDIAESLLTEVSMILVGEKDSTRAWTIMCDRPVAGG